MKPIHKPHPGVACLVEEHASLCRQLGALQRQVSLWMAQHRAEIHRLDRDNLRLRGQLMVTRTALLWGLSGVSVHVRAPGPGAPPTGQRARTPSLPEARQVLCQVACTGHAHVWLDGQGQCARSGQACDRLPD